MCRAAASLGLSVWRAMLWHGVGSFGRENLSTSILYFYAICSCLYVHGNTACLSLTAKPECENSPGKSLPYFLSIPVLVCVQFPLALLSYIICAGLSNLELAEMSVLLCFAKNIVLANTLSWNSCSVVCAEIKTLDIIIFWCLHSLVLSKEWRTWVLFVGKCHNSIVLSHTWHSKITDWYGPAKKEATR